MSTNATYMVCWRGLTLALESPIVGCASEIDVFNAVISVLSGEQDLLRCSRNAVEIRRAASQELKHSTAVFALGVHTELVRRCVTGLEEEWIDRFPPSQLTHDATTFWDCMAQLSATW